MTSSTSLRMKQAVWGILVLLIFCSVFGAGIAAAEEKNGTLSGQVVDVRGEPVAGVQVFVYRTSNIRKPADYLSAPTDRGGTYEVTMPAGEYWVLARLRSGDEQFGPLLPGDKHSGSPLEIEIYAGEIVEEDFVVADLAETSLLEKKYDTSFVRVDGMVRGENGQPVADAYAYANRSDSRKKIPDFVSAWSDDSGGFALFLPPGTYYFGAALEFPPDSWQGNLQKETIDSDGKNINIVIKEH